MSSNQFPLAYGCKHKNEKIRLNSRSGGFFTAISDVILEHGGVVYGCMLNERFEAVHERAETREERNKFRKSKYVQSNMQDSMRRVREDLLGGRDILFSGTPCQVDGLLNYLKLTNTDCSGLLTLDIVCHGVPSPKLWKDYLEYQEKKHGKIHSAEFRNKKDFGWEECIETLETENGTVNSKIYSALYYINYPLRRSCHECRYASKKRVSDITLADFWGIENICPEMNDNKGVSLILVNTEKGKMFFDKCLDSIEAKKINVDSADQKSLREPFWYSVKKEQFWEDYKNRGFEYIVKKYAQNSPAKKIVEKVAARLK